MPAYQAANTVCRALTSIAAQTLKPVSVIVVDDGSRDDTLGTANTMIDKMGSISLVTIRQENAGAGAARNRALREANSEFVAFLDADDEWIENKLERSMQALRQSQCDLVSHDYLMVRDNQKSAYVNCARHYENSSNPKLSQFLRGYIATSTVVARRRAIVEAGGFDETLRSGQDFDLWLALLVHQNLSFQVFGEALTKYHVTPGSITSQVAMRRHCNLIILHRYARGISSSMVHALKATVLRALIIQIQTIQAY